MIAQAMDVASLSTYRLLLRALTIGALVLGQGVRWLIGWLVLLLAFAGPARRRAWFGQCLLDLFVVSGEGGLSRLYRNEGKGHFTDVTLKAGLGAKESYQATRRIRNREFP